MVNVGKYIIHGSYGNDQTLSCSSSGRSMQCLLWHSLPIGWWDDWEVSGVPLDENGRLFFRHWRSEWTKIQPFVRATTGGDLLIMVINHLQVLGWSSKLVQPQPSIGTITYPHIPLDRHFWVVGSMLGCETNPSLNPLVMHQDDIGVCITLYVISNDDWVIPRVSMYGISIYMQLICRVNVGK